LHGVHEEQENAGTKCWLSRKYLVWDWTGKWEGVYEFRRAERRAFIHTSISSVTNIILGCTYAHKMLREIVAAADSWKDSLLYYNALGLTELHVTAAMPFHCGCI